MGGAKYKALFLDFYGTVAAGDADVVERTCARIVEELRLEMTGHELVRAWGDRFFATLEDRNGARFRTLYDCECESLVETLRPICGEIDPVPFVDRLTDYWCAPQLQPEAKEVMQSLSVPVCCVSNADTDHLHQAVALHGLCFDAVVTSEDARSYKPHGGIFALACDVMGIEPQEALHAGDSLHSDIGGAAALGMDCVWVCRDRRIYDIGEGGDHVATHKVSSLMGLRSLLA